MAFFKAFFFATIVAVAVAQQASQDEIYGDVPKYQFQYSVADPNTGDQKQQEEVRDGDSVRGFYSLIEPDGTLRRVDYTADDVHGFQAVVSKQAGAAHPVPVTAARTVAIAQPTVVHAAPAVYHAPAPTAIYHAPAPAIYHAPAPAIYHAPAVATTLHAAPVVQTYHAPVSSQIVSHAPVVSTIPQYIQNRVVAL